MENEIEMFFGNDGTSYLESIIKSRALLYKYGVHGDTGPMITKIDELIHLELDLAITGAKKAITESKKDTAKVTPLKGV